MPVTAVVGAQWGDEGKGRIIDWLAAEANLVIRCQGGANVAIFAAVAAARTRIHGQLRWRSESQTAP